MPSTPYKYGQQLNVTPTAASGNSTAISLPSKSQHMVVTFLIGLTIGSADSITVTPQVTYDGSTWYNVTAATPAAKTADENFSITLNAAGCKQARIHYVAAGTRTGSALTVDAVTQAA